MKHIISWVLRLPSREGVRLTIAPSRPAPPHFEPPPSWGRVRGVGPEAQRGMLAAYLPAIPLQGLIDFQPTRCQALFSSLCCTAWGWRVCLGWGEMKLIRSCVYVAIFIVRAKCCMDLIFCGFHLQHIYTCRVERSYLWPPLFVPWGKLKPGEGCPIVIICWITELPIL